MTLIVFGALWVPIVLRTDQVVPEYLKNLLFIILGPDSAAQGQTDQVQEPWPSPLCQPRGSVRLLVIAGFVVSAVPLFRLGQVVAIGLAGVVRFSFGSRS